MKKMTKTLLILTPLTLFACSGPAVQKTVASKEATTSRGPASTASTPKAWGKPVNPQSQDILEEIENAPNGSYPGQPVP